MKITKLNIRSFGALRDREIVLSDGLNVIGGANESGKTSLATFIKFMLYGLGGRATEQFPTGEKRRFISWDTERAEGSMEFTVSGRPYRVDRSCAFTGNGDATRERKTVTDLETGEIVKLSGEVGEAFLGVTEDVFVNTVFVRQLGDASVDRASLGAAVENMLSSADEKIGIDKAVKKLDRLRVELMHKGSVGGEIRELREKIASCEAELEEARRASGEVIAAQAGLERCTAEAEKAKANAEHARLVASLYRDIRALGEREKMRSYVADYERVRSELKAAENDRPSPKARGELSRLKSSLAAARTVEAEAKKELVGLGEVRELPMTDDECDAAILDAQSLEKDARSRVVPAIVLAALGVMLLGAGLAVYLAKLATAAVAAVSGALGLVALGAAVWLFVTANGKKARLREMCEENGAKSADELEKHFRRMKTEIEAGTKKRILKSAAEEDHAAAEKRLCECEAEIAAFTADYVGDTADADEAVRLCEAAFDERDTRALEAKEKAVGLAGELRGMDERLSQYDFDAIKLRRLEHEFTPAWDEAQSLDREGYERVKLSIGFNESKLLALKDQIADHRETLAARQGRTATQINEEILALREELSEKELRYDALVLATDTLGEAGEAVRLSIIPRLVKKASEIFDAATDGRHPSMGIGRDFSLCCESGGAVRSADYLSAGSADAAYISLRLALAGEIFRGCTPPVILDESFGKIDEKRADALMGILADGDFQSLVFTCREGDVRRAKERFADRAKVTVL